MSSIASCNDGPPVWGYLDPSGITITSQADIDNGALLHYKPSTDVIRLHDAKGTLNFTNLTSFYQMDIQSNNELENIVFPDLHVFNTLLIDEALALRNINMDRLNVSGSMNAIHIRKTPQLGSSDGSQFQFFYGTAYKEGVWLNNAGSVRFPNLTNTEIVSIVDTNAEFPKLETVSEELYVTNPNIGHTSFMSLTNASTFCFGNASVESDSVLGYPSSTDLVVQRSMVIGPMSAGSGGKQPPMNIVDGNLILDQLTKVGEDLNITGNRGVVGFSFNRLGDVRRLNIMDNPNSTISLAFPRLTSANSIWINGIINTSTNSLFYPSSRVVRMRIEPWNSDFDCSRLVKMRDAGVIGSLSCNGTNGTNDGGGRSIDPDSPAPASISNSGLSTAASAGIGVGVGIAAIGIITAFTWLIVHYRRKLRSLTAKSHDTKNRNNHRESNEREAPEVLLDGTQIREAGGRSLPHQAGSEQILEAGGRELRAEASGDECVRERATGPKQELRSPVELD